MKFFKNIILFFVLPLYPQPPQTTFILPCNKKEAFAQDLIFKKISVHTRHPVPAIIVLEEQDNTTNTICVTPYQNTNASQVTVRYHHYEQNVCITLNAQHPIRVTLGILSSQTKNRGFSLIPHPNGKGYTFSIVS